MESIQVELPPTLLDRIRVEASNKSLNQVVAEAIQMWLERHKKIYGRCVGFIGRPGGHG